MARFGSGAHHQLAGGAHRLLRDNRDLLDEIARKLLDDEVIDQAEIAALMARHEVTVAVAGPFPDPDESRSPDPVGNGAAAGIANARDDEDERTARGSEPPPPGRA